MSDALSRWRERHREASGRARVLTALARVSDRRRSQRAEMRLALKTWRRNACGGGDGGLVDGDGEGGGGGGGGGEVAVEEDGLLEAVAGVFVEAAAAFSTASSVRSCVADVCLVGGSCVACVFSVGACGRDDVCARRWAAHSAQEWVARHAVRITMES